MKNKKYNITLKSFNSQQYFNIKHHSRKLKMYSRTHQAAYTKPIIQETQPQALRTRPFSQHSNITPQHSHHQSLNLKLPDDKISEIKQKYDKSYIPNNNKILGEANSFSTASMNFKKSPNKYQSYDENTSLSQQRQYPNDRSVHDHVRSTSDQHYIQRTSYGKEPVKSQMQSSLDALNSMKNQLKTKLNDLASKSQSSKSPYLKDKTAKQRSQCPLDRSYDLIVSKYSKNGDYQQEINSNYSKYKPEFESSRKNIPQQANQSYLYNYSFANKSQIFDKNPTNELSSIADPLHHQYSFSKQNGKQRESQDVQNRDRYRDNTIESTLLHDKKYQVDNKYRDYKATSSYIKQRQQQKGNLQFTLRKQQQPQRPTGKNNDNSALNQAEKKYENRTQPIYSYQNSVSLQYDANYLKSYKQQNVNKITRSPCKESRSPETINRQIQKLDNKIKQIERNKKALNIEFNPYSPSKNSNKVANNTKQTHKYDIQISSKPDIPLKSSILPNSSSNLSNVDRNKRNINIRHQDIQQISSLSNKNLSFDTIKNKQKSIAIPYTPAQSQNDDEQFNTERSNADQSFESKKLKNCINQGEVSNNRDNEERKKQQINNTIKALVRALGQQVSLDEIFRNNKIWFASENYQKKWASLKKQLHNYNMNISQTLLKDTFSLEESENNPFFSVSDAKCNIQSLAQSYVQAQSHWEQKISRKFCKADLEREGLNNNKVDYDRKGFLEVQDLVRFLNIESGTFFRLRDLSVIFKRITKGKKMQFNEFLEAVSA